MKKEAKRKMKAVAAAVMLGVATMFGALSCSNGSTSPSPCACTDNEHLGFNENCGCGGTDCNCKPKNYDYLMTGSGTGIKIYRDKSVTDTDMEIFVTTALKPAFDLDTSSFVSTVKSKVEEIHIVPTQLDCHCTPTGVGKYVVGISVTFDDIDIDSSFAYWIGTGILVKSHQKDIIRLAGEFNNSKETVRFAMSKLNA